MTVVIEAGFNKAAPSRLLDLLADGDDPFKDLTEEKMAEEPATVQEDFDEFQDASESNNTPQII